MSTPWWFFLIAAGLIVMSGFFSGLNLGLMSLAPDELKVVMEGSADEQAKRDAAKIYPLRKRGNLGRVDAPARGNIMTFQQVTCFFIGGGGGGGQLLRGLAPPQRRARHPQRELRAAQQVVAQEDAPDARHRPRRSSHGEEGRHDDRRVEGVEPAQHARVAVREHRALGRGRQAVDHERGTQVRRRPS